MEKAKTHYDAKKQQNQELLEKLKRLQHLEKENAELKAESERLAKELQRTALQATESELSLKSLTSQVRVLQAQVGGTASRAALAGAEYQERIVLFF